ncbi:hypothetical protein Q5752_006269 [Cryptotrichosporon argae]
MSTPVLVRPATDADIAAVNALHAHYVLHTVLTFGLTPNTDGDALSKLHAVRAAGLPYAVAEAGGAVVGFSYVAPFRAVLAGYAHTVELSLFCAPEWVGKAIGRRLLERVLDVLCHPEAYGDEWVSEHRRTDGRVAQVLAVMALDEQGRDGGWALKEWYERFGFVQAGYLRRVGKKFGRWSVRVGRCRRGADARLDTVYLQLDVGSG